LSRRSGASCSIYVPKLELGNEMVVELGNEMVVEIGNEMITEERHFENKDQHGTALHPPPAPPIKGGGRESTPTEKS
jgi:hypothetical protein